MIFVNIMNLTLKL
ncbi:hypothetical protein Avbf_12799 [Armadillidium vulgare]|nr:hypothetical protein Avbf_12799 [Armadillidium vulgare]